MHDIQIHGLLTAGVVATALALAQIASGKPLPREMNYDLDGDGFPDEAPAEDPAEKATAAAHALVNELSVMGTIHGGASPTLRDAAVLLDLVSGRTVVLGVGQCLPRLPRVCVHEIRDRTVLFGAPPGHPNEGELIEVERIDGAQPRGTSTYGSQNTPPYSAARMQTKGLGGIPRAPIRLAQPPPPRDDQLAPRERLTGGHFGAATGQRQGRAGTEAPNEG